MLFSFFKKTFSWFLKPVTQIFDYFFPGIPQKIRTQLLPVGKFPKQRIKRLIDRMLNIASLYELSSRHDNILSQYLSQAPQDHEVMRRFSKRLTYLKQYRATSTRSGQAITEYDLFINAMLSLRETRGYSLERYIKTTPVAGIVEELERQVDRLEKIYTRLCTFQYQVKPNLPRLPQEIAHPMSANPGIRLGN